MPTYTLNELIQEMEPQSKKDRALAGRCIDGLTRYAAELRRRGGPDGQAKIPELRKLTGCLASYWGLGEEPGGLDEAACHEMFDRRMEEAHAKTTRQPLLGEKIDIVLGLYRYAMDMIPNLGSDAKEEVVGCRALIREIEAFWNFGAPLLNRLYDDIGTALQEQIDHEKALEMGGIQ